MTTVARVTLFLDYQNVYSSARRAFHQPLDPGHCGQVDPCALGELIVEQRRKRYPSELQTVRVYRGLPDASKQPKAYGANRAQATAWQRDERCHVEMRPLRYPDDWPESKAEEKGIDVKIALDLAMGAVRGAYDVAVVFSADTDLRPALEEVFRIAQERDGPFPWCEVAAWKPANQPARRLNLPGRKLWCHFLDERAYDRVRDPTDYVRNRP